MFSATFILTFVLDMGYKEVGQSILYAIFDPLVRLLKSMGITPNHITMIGLVLNALAALHLLSYFTTSTFTYGENLIGFGVILGFAGVMDTLDGRLARLFDMKSDFGAFFDSVIDRYSEFIMFLGMILYYYFNGIIAGVIICFVACMSSIMVSYTRSRAESLGVDCSVGVMQRPERIVFVGLWCIIWGAIYTATPSMGEAIVGGLDYFTIGLLLFAVFTTGTAIRRLLHTRNLLLTRGV